MQRNIITLAASFAFAASSVAAALPISQAHIPVRASEWHELSDAAKSGYALGAMQVAAYIETDTDAQSGCVARLDEAFIAYLDAGVSDSEFVVFDAIDMAMGACSSAPAQDDGMISVQRVSTVLGADQTSEVWYGVVIGMADYLKVQVFGTFGKSAADCVEDVALGVAGIDISDARTLTDTPDDPFIELVATAALNQCGLID